MVKGMTRERLLTQAIANMAATSRTKKGVSDTSSSADKPALATTGQVLADQATKNFEEAIEMVWGSRSIDLSSPEDLRRWVEMLAAIVSNGLLPAGQGMYRTWATKFAMQTMPDQLDAEMENFYLQFGFRGPFVDPVETAAWVEHKLDARIHPFADGCGRTAKLVSAWVLLRANHPLPAWDSRERYLESLIQGGPAFTAYYRERIAAQQL